MKAKGFTLIELLLVIGIIAILAGLILGATLSSRGKANANGVRGGVRQMRLLAEQVYDSQGASYLDWTQHTTIASDYAALLADIEKHSGTPGGAVIIDSREDDYCVSSPLEPGGNSVCIDRLGVMYEPTTPCVEPDDEDDPLRCPAPI